MAASNGVGAVAGSGRTVVVDMRIPVVFGSGAPLISRTMLHFHGFSANVAADDKRVARFYGQLVLSDRTLDVTLTVPAAAFATSDLCVVQATPVVLGPADSPAPVRGATAHRDDDGNWQVTYEH